MRPPLTVRCPRCKAGRGIECRSPKTKLPCPPHTNRIAKAGGNRSFERVSD